MEYTITQITDNNFNDIFAQVSGENLVWIAGDGNDPEIFFYDGTDIVQLTDNEVFDRLPQISGNNLIWQQSSNDPSDDPSTTTELVFYDGTTTTTLASINGVFSPAIDGNNVVWGEPNQVSGDNIPGISEGPIFLYNGTETIQLSDSGYFESTFFGINSEAISGDKVVWTELGQVFLYDGVNTTQITDNNLSNSNPIVSGNNIAWNSINFFTEAGEGLEDEEISKAREIFFYNGTDIVQLTDNNVADRVAGISDNGVVWGSGDDFDRAELFFYNGTETIQLTDGDPATNNFFGGISGSNVVWSEDDGNDLEIFLYDGNTTTQLTDNDTEELANDIDGNNIVWEGNIERTGSESDVEVFLASLNTNNENNSATVYRFLNNDTDVHFYTANEVEKDAVEELANFSFEGASYQGVDPLTGQESLPVYRFLNQDTGVHLYTISETERETVAELPNFSFEGEAFSAYDSAIEGSIPIYRFFNPTTGAHFYTPSATERDFVDSELPNYQSEGIAYYALPIE